MHPQSGKNLRRRLTWLAWGATQLTLLAYVWPFTIDDAYIVARFARNLGSTGTWGMNPGTPSDGVTSPLFLLLVTVLTKLGVPAMLAQKSLGAFCFLVAQGMAMRGWLAHDTQARWLLLIANTGFAGLWAVSGLETGLTSLVLVAALPVHGAGWSTLFRQIASALIPWLRPELTPLVLLFRTFEIELWNPRAALLGFAPALLGVTSVGVFRVALFGSPLPLALFAKQLDLAHGLRYAAAGSVVGAMFVALAWAHLSSRDAWRVVTMWTVAALTIAIAGGDWMPGFRLFQPVYLTLFTYVGRLRQQSERSRAKNATRVFALTWGIAVLMTFAVLRDRSNFVVNRSALRPMRETISQCATVALVDVGYLVFDSDVRVVDLGGLTDRDVAMLPGGHLRKAVTLEFLRARDVDCVVLHRGRHVFPVEAGLRRALVARASPVVMHAEIDTASGPYRYELYRM